MQEQFELSEEQKKALGEAMDSASSGGVLRPLPNSARNGDWSDMFRR